VAYARGVDEGFCKTQITQNIITHLNIFGKVKPGSKLSVSAEIEKSRRVVESRARPMCLGLNQDVFCVAAWKTIHHKTIWSLLSICMYFSHASFMHR
jgi:hypothetical protein